MLTARIHSFNIECPNCFLFHCVPASAIGRKAVCSHCRETFRLPNDKRVSEKPIAPDTNLIKKKVTKALTTMGYPSNLVKKAANKIWYDGITLDEAIRKIVLELS